MKPRYFIGLTATVRRNDGLDRVLDIFWGSRKEWIVRLKEFGEECTMDLQILYTPFVIDNIYDRRGTLDWNGMAETVANIDERNILIRNLCLMHCKSKILILCKRKEHVETLSTLMRNTGMDVSTYYEKSKNYYDAHVLIATLSKAGRGYDDK
jgi:superfamily II DNA or RNA helicase